jgi:hypothetical protein
LTQKDAISLGKNPNLAASAEVETLRIGPTSIQRNYDRFERRVIVYLEIENAWIVCPLGPQHFDCHDGFVDDCNGGVFDSIDPAPIIGRQGIRCFITVSKQTRL